MFAGIPLNSVILAIDGEPLQGKAREEISDMMRHFVGTRMNVHMKMPNVSDDSHAVTRMVYLHKKGDRSEFFGPLSMPDIRQGLSSGQTESQSDVTDNDDTTLEEEDDEGFIGLSISHTKPVIPQTWIPVMCVVSVRAHVAGALYFRPSAHAQLGVKD